LVETNLARADLVRNSNSATVKPPDGGENAGKPFMTVNLPAVGELLAVPGVLLGTSYAGVKSVAEDSPSAGNSERDDLLVIALGAKTTVAGVFTRSSFRAAPVEIAAERIELGGVRALVINSGNANAATGAPGHADALAICDAVANSLDLPVSSVLPFSTGVIGERLPITPMIKGVDIACGRLEPNRWEAAARAIMTTDTQPKVLSNRVDVDGKIVTLTGMAKGAGMIKPDMATMLAFVCCDADISSECLARLTREVADQSFNRITVDGDTSTNDSFVVCATGVVGQVPIRTTDCVGYAALREGVMALAKELAQRVIRDGEGATKFVSVRVMGGASPAECLQVAYTVAESPLVKTAIFAGDPNWGRFCMAIGRAGINDLDTSGVNLFLNDVQVAAAGLVADDYQETAGVAVMEQDEFEVRIELGRGDCEEVIWTTDLSYEYVRINAEYRT
jgi:glutamate N-acetyltransferase/amino-acid N-acetyltransferase